MCVYIYMRARARARVCVCVCVCVWWYFGWLFPLDQSFPSSLHHSLTLSPTLCVFYIFCISSPISPIFPSLAPPFFCSLAFFRKLAQDSLHIRPGIAREMFNVLSISVTGIPHEHTWLIDWAYRACIRQHAVLFSRKDTYVQIYHF